MENFFDNVNNRVIDNLKETICKGSKLSIAAASFSIYAYEALKKELDSIEGLRFIFESPTFDQQKVSKEKREFYIPKLNRERNLYGTEFEIKLRNNLTQKAIAKECADWIRRKVKFKTNITNGGIPKSLNVENGGYKLTYMPFNDFTTSELGCEKGSNMSTAITRLASPISESFLQQFDELWNDKKNFKDVTDRVIESIENVYKENAPEFIYFVTLFNIFREFLDDISEDDLPNEATGFKNSVIWSKLYNFQKDACLAIINKLEKYNGCILADSVGLGKTFTALSVIKYYENRNKSVLVLCPKKLNDNWMMYRSNYKNNPIAGDRLRYDVLFHTDLSREQGHSNGLDLSMINWGNYDLLVIDESHNFRNGGKIDAEEDDDSQRNNRYTQLMNKVIRAGVKTKVLMLSATPVNNRFNDLKNQLQLAYEGNPELINKELNTKSSIDDIFKNAQKAYKKWTELPESDRTTERLLQELSFDFFEVLDSVTIARSRKHIERYYDTTDIGTFPERLKPISRTAKLTDLEGAPDFDEIFTILQEIKLSIYVPSEYLLPSARSKYEDRDEDTNHVFSVEARERGIHRLMSIGILKRLESSVNSFRLTLERIKEKIETTIQKIDNSENIEVDDYDVNASDESDDLFIGNKKNKIAIQDLDTISWRRDLEHDLELFKHLLKRIACVTALHDSKLQTLIKDIAQKVTHPINEGNKKVIIFTAFSDTAVYLYDSIANGLKDTLGLNTALVSGEVEARSTISLPSRQRLDFNTVLTLFSPVSKEKQLIFPNIQQEIDILIATDCISEGQNLQDCDYLVNYDIHWNPVRIIQRFGRIDRIGSKNSRIQLVNYWPDMNLDDYINLKARVESRMKATILTATGDDNLLDANEKGDLEYRKDQLRRLHEEVVDLEDMNSGISIMDLGLNEFRLDLLSYMKENEDIEHAPFGLHAVAPASTDNERGVIFILKNIANAVNIDHTNRLHPFYMVYVDVAGNVLVNHLQPKELLDKMRLLCKGRNQPIQELTRMFNAETKDGKDMRKYSELLGEAIASIITVKDESDVMNFLKGAAEPQFVNNFNGLDDFELISFLIVK